MSFILDALRKSENERQRNQQPGIAVAQSPQQRKSSGIWLPLVALLVGVNLSLLIVMWLMSGNEQAAAPAVVAPAAPVPMPTAPAPGVMPAPPPTAVAPPPAATNPPTVRVMPEPATEFGAQQAVSPASETEEAAEAADAESTLPTLEELILGNLISLPTLNMDIHVYSEIPAERFVFINMKRYNEGQTLSEGPALLEITPAGVVLRHQGYDFLVTRE